MESFLKQRDLYVHMLQFSMSVQMANKSKNYLFNEVMFPFKKGALINQEKLVPHLNSLTKKKKNTPVKPLTRCYTANQPRGKMILSLDRSNMFLQRKSVFFAVEISFLLLFPYRSLDAGSLGLVAGPLPRDKTKRLTCKQGTIKDKKIPQNYYP